MRYIPVNEMEPAREEFAPALPAIIGAVTVLLCSGLLPALAGPHILPDAKAARFATSLWIIHAFVFFVMGYAGGARGGRRGAASGAGVAAITGIAAALFYSRLGLLASSPTTLVGMALMGLGAGVLGGLLGAALPGTAMWAAGVWAGVGLLALAGTLLRIGVISGTATRTIDEITVGMMTGQKEVPVPGIPIILCMPDGKTRLYETITSSTGNYVFNGPRPGEYMLFGNDIEPERGSGQWVSVRVRAAGQLTGQGIGAGNISLPTYRLEQGSPFLDKAPAASAPAPPAPGSAGGGGTQGQMQRLLDGAMGGR